MIQRTTEGMRKVYRARFEEHLNCSSNINQRADRTEKVYASTLNLQLSIKENETVDLDLALR